MSLEPISVWSQILYHEEPDNISGARDYIMLKGTLVFSFSLSQAEQNLEYLKTRVLLSHWQKTSKIEFFCLKSKNTIFRGLKYKNPVFILSTF